MDKMLEPSLPPVPTVLSFIDRINHRDLDGLLALMTDDHVLAVLDEPPLQGKTALRAGWQAYFDAFPAYLIYPERISNADNQVGVLGHTTGSHLGLPDAGEAQLPVIWAAEVEAGRIRRWSILADSPATRARLGLSNP